MSKTGLTIIFVSAFNHLPYIQTNTGFVDREELKEAIMKSFKGQLLTGVPESQYYKVWEFEDFKERYSEEISNAVEASFSFSDKYVCIC